MRAFVETQARIDVTAAHLLIELLDTPSVATILQDEDVNAEALVKAVRLHVPSALPNAKPRPAAYAPDAQACMNHAAVHVLSSDSEEITSPLVLLAYFALESTVSLKQALELAGLSEYALRVHVAHGPNASLDPQPTEGPVTIVIHNDPFTTREFVREVLTEVFAVPPARAEQLVVEIHKSGFGAVATFSGPHALERVAELRQRALANGFPLRVTLESETKAGAA